MRPPLAALALIACLSLPFGRLDAEKARHASRKVPKIEMTLSGPTTVRSNESLESQRYKVLLTNRSADPLVLFVRGQYLMNARWDWTVTDAKGGPVGMEFVSHGYCGTVPYSAEAEIAWHHIHDEDVVTLQPGDSREFSVPVGPSDLYSFPRAGTYHLSVAMTYVPPNAGEFLDQRGKRFKALGYDQWDLSELTPDAFQTLNNSLSVQATSTSWNLQLASRRRPQ
jgi:hypothetical protein